MFAMTSMGAKVIDSINDGHGPYVFNISGYVYHRIGSLIPSQGARQNMPNYIFLTQITRSQIESMLCHLQEVHSMPMKILSNP
jgi:hypothetical protein